MATATEIIRANLIGLPAELTDTIIEIVISSSKSLHDAAIALCDSAASLAAEDSSDIKIGSLAISSGKTAEYWLKIKDNLIKRSLLGEGVIIDPNETVYVSGYAATITGDDITRQVWTNQFDDPAASNPV